MTKGINENITTEILLLIPEAAWAEQTDIRKKLAISNNELADV